MLEQDAPEALGLNPTRFAAALNMLEHWCATGKIPAAALIVGRNGKTTGAYRFGRQELQDKPGTIVDNSLFLVASITKPVVGTAALLLAERGLITLDDRVEEYLPEFGRHGKHAITIRNLLTHTSGLPDMLPNNADLRRAGALLPEFVAAVCNVEPAFAPGTAVQYQSMGFVILAEIVHRISARPVGQFLKDELFTPLGMQDSYLGVPIGWFAGQVRESRRVVENRIPEHDGQESSWNWNSRYWRTFGAPWGGLITTPEDLARFAQLWLASGRAGETHVLSPAAVRIATSNQLDWFKDVPEHERRCRPWGLAWRLNWPGNSASFGDFLGPRSFGHWGATGTVMWIDPDLNGFCVLLTTLPQEPRGSYLARISNMVATACL